MGFRAGAGIAGWLLAAVILLLFTLAMTWTAVMFGLLASNAEGVGVFSYILLFLIFISSAFAPTQTMPPAVRIFAENQPMTPIIEAVRSLLLGGSAGNNAITAILWCLGILIVTYIASVGFTSEKLLSQHILRWVYDVSILSLIQAVELASKSMELIS